METDYYLDQLGIIRWQLRSTNNAPTKNDADSSSEALINRIAQCQACSLHKTRKNTVFGTGSLQASLMIIGEAPGAEEDRQGQPFVGRAGQLLTEMLRAIGLSREAVFITNILKCRPPGNRDPLLEEVQQCTPFLEQQIQMVRPRLLLALGRIAAHYLLKTTTPLGKLRGQQFQFGVDATPLMVTYHPAYLLRNLEDKSKAFIDLSQAKILLAKLTA